jgi:hypothetical protein
MLPSQNDCRSPPGWSICGIGRKATGDPFDYCDAAVGLKHIDPFVAGLLHIMIGISTASPMLRKS